MLPHFSRGLFLEILDLGVSFSYLCHGGDGWEQDEEPGCVLPQDLACTPAKAHTVAGAPLLGSLRFLGAATTGCMRLYLGQIKVR